MARKLFARAKVMAYKDQCYHFLVLETNIIVDADDWDRVRHGN